MNLNKIYNSSLKHFSMWFIETQEKSNLPLRVAYVSWTHTLRARMCVCVYVCYAWSTKVSVMMQDGRMFYFANAAIIRQLSEVLVKNIKAWKEYRDGRKVARD
jgi:hypothetical protein